MAVKQKYRFSASQRIKCHIRHKANAHSFTVGSQYYVRVNNKQTKSHDIGSWIDLFIDSE